MGDVLDSGLEALQNVGDDLIGQEHVLIAPTLIGLVVGVFLPGEMCIRDRVYAKLCGNAALEEEGNLLYQVYFSKFRTMQAQAQFVA